MNTETKYTLKRYSEPSKDRVDFKVIVNGVEVHRAFLTKEGPGGYIGRMPSFVQTSEDRAKYIRAAHKLFHEQTSYFTLASEEDRPYTEKWFRDARSHNWERNDLLALKERMEHLPKMIDTLNELLKNGQKKDASNLAYDIEHYAYRIARAMDSTKYTCMPNSSGKITAKLY
jgi:hypothetical protein